jgi:hypothetical protein
MKHLPDALKRLHALERRIAELENRSDGKAENDSGVKFLFGHRTSHGQPHHDPLQAGAARQRHYLLPGGPAGPPGIKADVDHVVDVSRGTTIGINGVRVHTVEHVLAAAAGLGIDNLEIEVDANETPVGDGSALPSCCP